MKRREGLYPSSPQLSCAGAALTMAYGLHYVFFASPPRHNANCTDVQIWAAEKTDCASVTGIFRSKHVAKQDIGWESSVDWPSKHKNC
ncbi:hypothetical protein E2320_014699, partial [Naja naja]